MVDAISVVFSPEYTPLMAEIDKACDTCGISRAGLVRSLLCDVFEFTPERSMKPYRSFSKRSYNKNKTRVKQE